MYTQRGNRLYVHVLSWLLTHLHLPHLAGEVSYAQLLHDGSEVTLHTLTEHDDSPIAPIRQPPGTLSIELPIQRPDVLAPVLELHLANG